jgi:hypothetical protein
MIIEILLMAIVIILLLGAARIRKMISLFFHYLFLSVWTLFGVLSNLVKGFLKAFVTPITRKNWGWIAFAGIIYFFIAVWIWELSH